MTVSRTIAELAMGIAPLWEVGLYVVTVILVRSLSRVMTVIKTSVARVMELVQGMVSVLCVEMIIGVLK